MTTLTSKYYRDKIIYLSLSLLIGDLVFDISLCKAFSIILSDIVPYVKKLYIIPSKLCGYVIKKFSIFVKNLII